MEKYIWNWEWILKHLPPPEEDILRKLSVRHVGNVVRHFIDKERYKERGSIEQGRKKLAENEYREAYDIFSQIIQKNSTSRWAIHGLGDACQFMSCYEEALHSYQKAYELSLALAHTKDFEKEKALHLAGIGNALTGLGRTEEANSIWKQVIDLDESLLWMKENAQNTISKKQAKNK